MSNITLVAEFLLKDIERFKEDINYFIGKLDTLSVTCYSQKESDEFKQRGAKYNTHSISLGLNDIENGLEHLRRAIHRLSPTD